MYNKCIIVLSLERKIGKKTAKRKNRSNVIINTREDHSRKCILFI